MRACSTEAVLVQHRLLLSANWVMLLMAGGESVQPAAVHAHGAFSVLVNELLWNKFGLLLLTARTIPAWRLLPHQRRAKLPEGEAALGESSFLRHPSMCQHYCK